MWIANLFQMIWNSIFQVEIPILGGITFGSLGITIMLMLVLTSIFKDFHNKGE